MRLVVNSSVLFSFFKKLSHTRKIILSGELELINPGFSFKEIRGHTDEILKLSKSDIGVFGVYEAMLPRFVRFVPLKEYAKFLEKAMHLSPDPDDIDFFALSLKYDKIPIWSEDPHFRMQSEIKVFTTRELIEFLSGLK